MGANSCGEHGDHSHSGVVLYSIHFLARDNFEPEMCVQQRME